MGSKSVLIASALTASLLLGACSGEKDYTKEEEKEVLSELITEDVANADTEEFKQRMDTEIPRMSVDGASDLIDAWLYTLYSEVDALNTKLTGFQDDLAKLKEDGIDVADSKVRAEQIKKIDDETLATLLREIDKYPVVLKGDSEEYYLTPDFPAIKKEYGKYMRDDMKAYIDLSVEETKTDFYNEEEKTFDLNIIAERILTLESMIEKYPDSVYHSSFQQTQVYYYQLYFGSNNAMLMNADGDAFLEEVVNTYKLHVDTYKDTLFAKDLAKVVAILDRSNGKITTELTDTLNEIITDRSPEEWVEYQENAQNDGNGTSVETSKEKSTDAK